MLAKSKLTSIELIGTIRQILLVYNDKVNRYFKLKEGIQKKKFIKQYWLS